ncbi:MAG: hypothetical protein EOO52_09340 [Gammaproteobacteria bacterium]|nr:MAG: hypothetical protein EOO52_09340 [Gammaproteobacteria bacterium]
MSTSQLAFQPDSRECESVPTLGLEHVSVSQLLGRDYLFIDTQQVALPRNNPNLLHTQLDDLIARLELTEAHTVAVSVRELPDGTACFTRHDLTWHQHKVCRVESIDVTHAEQYEFMDMIWRCSTSALPI